MAGVLDPVLRKDLGEAKAALARHGIVIMRGVENDLEPAIMVAFRDSLASSPSKLKGMSDAQLDAFMDEARAEASDSAKKLSELHTHVLAKLGTEYIGELVRELDGIDQLFNWQRIARVADPVDALLKERGFRPLALSGPSDVSEAFAVELEDRWPAAFRRFRALAVEAVERLGDEALPQKQTAPTPKKKGKKG